MHLGPRVLASLTRSLALVLALVPVIGAAKHAPCQAPLEELAGDAPTLLFSLLEDSARSDPMLALEAGRALLAHKAIGSKSAERLRVVLGIGQVRLLLGSADEAIEASRHVEASLEVAGLAASNAGVAKRLAAGARALEIRALLYRGAFGDALLAARRAEKALGLDDAELRSAHAAALYRNRRFNEAAAAYRGLLRDDPLHVEALMRLGGGLQEARPAPVDASLALAIALRKRGEDGRARVGLSRVLASHTEHPTALRMLGELELTAERQKNPLVARGFFEEQFHALDPVRVEPWVLRFVPDYRALDEGRRQMVRVSLRPFGDELRRVLEKGGRHDLLAAGERTTDASERAFLRGQKTFDGRVWDDVRGIGGLCAATGVEALDEAREGGFQTLVHEFAHQLHFHAMSASESAEIDRLYARAKRLGLTLDYYAASNAGEYFAQGFEAWFSLVKVPGQPITHGHTRFELERKDPELAQFIARVARFDPLMDGLGDPAQANARARWAALFRAAKDAVRPQDAADILARLQKAGGTRDSGLAGELDALNERLGCCSGHGRAAQPR